MFLFLPIKNTNAAGCQLWIKYCEESHQNFYYCTDTGCYRAGGQCMLILRQKPKPGAPPYECICIAPA